MTVLFQITADLTLYVRRAQCTRLIEDMERITSFVNRNADDDLLLSSGNSIGSTQKHSAEDSLLKQSSPLRAHTLPESLMNSPETKER